MSAVTLTPKCYIFSCAGCNKLAESDRSDQMTCSGACRVRAHRNGALKTLRTLANRFDVPPAMILQARATEMLRPDLSAQVMAGTVEYEHVRRDVRNAYREVLRRAVEMATVDMKPSYPVST